MPKPATKKAPAATNGVTLTQVNKSIKDMVKSSQAFGMAATSASMLALTHCVQHGDTTGLQRLHAALGTTGERVGPQRQKAFMAWLKAYTPVRRNNKTGDFGLIKKTAPNYVEFDIDSAESTPFLDFIPESNRKPLVTSNATIAKRVATAIQKEYEEGRWEGPAANLDAIVTQVRAILNPVDVEPNF